MKILLTKLQKKWINKNLSEPPSSKFVNTHKNGRKSKFANVNDTESLGNNLNDLVVAEAAKQLSEGHKKVKDRPTSSKSKMSRTSRALPKVTNIENKEMDWFAFENRVREIVRDILEPYAIRSIDIGESLTTLSESHDKFKRKQDEMEFVMHKRNHKNSGIDELNKKLFDIENERKVKEARNMQAIEGLKIQLEASTDRMTQIEELSMTFK
jgi:hypothetical protein